MSPSAEFKNLNFRIGVILGKIFFRHPPITSSFTIRKKLPQFLYGKDKNDNPVFYVRGDCEVSLTPKGITGRDSFLYVFGADANRLCFGSRLSASTFY